MSLPYRPEIDGLRAIAVLAVLLYHAGFTVAGTQVLPGGFLGVDVFFVISGYLITSILIKDLDAGSFSFARFYLRRARRILPALVLVIACTTVLALFIVRLEGLREYYATALAALWFGSNIVLWRQGNYYAQPSELKPLLHTWSLGIEEQFYLGFPVLLYLLYRYARPYLLPLLLLACTLSLALAEYGSARYPSATFYLLPTRAWELAAGALLAFTGGTTLESSGSKTQWLGAAGFTLILLSLCIFDAQTRHPSLLTLLPVTGATLVIRFSGASATDPVTRLLRSKALVAIGLISYGLYLWHFPLFAFYRYGQGEPSVAVKVGLLLLAALLATVSYHLFEKPLRFSPALKPRVFVQGMSCAVLALSVAAAFGYASSERQVSTLAIDGRSFDVDREKDKRFARIVEGCRAIGFQACNRTQPGKHNVLIAGDSVVDDAYNILDVLYPDYHFMRSTQGGCPPHRDLASILTFELPDLQTCLALNRERFTPGALEGVEGVVIHIDYSWFTPRDLEPYLEFLRSEGVDRIMLFGTYVTLTQSMAESIAVFSGDNAYADLLDAGIVESQFSFEEELAALAARYGAEFISIRQAACKADDCTIFVAGYPYTWDDVHFSMEFSEHLATQLEPRLRNTWLNRLGAR